ncbi:nitroreductase/quinone reductase family protein [Longispora albida]|uniref:nitroreductase/quinone reductase family protein n=1 Tax=Longispora albida TaxID=203523 RepID=UPI000381D2CE|nr:nitroreductase/quinone reductase family protein [Longispora albida]
MTSTISGTGAQHLGTANRLVLGILHSPLHFLLDPGICELAFTGHRTGRLIRLPVMYAKEGPTVVVLAGNAEAKRWWRNFRSPRPVTVTLAEQALPGTAAVIRASDPGYDEATAIYWARHPGVRLLPGDKLIRITLQEQPSCA